MFHFPLLVVSCHLVLKFTLAIIGRFLYHKTMKIPFVKVSLDSNISKLAPVGISGGIDVGLSNWGLELVNVSLYTMTKSTAIIFVMINTLVLRLEKASVTLFIIVFSISGGLFLFTFKAADFNTLGFILLLTASFASGFRWTLSQFIMQKADIGMKSPLDMMYFSQPWMFITIFPISLLLEGNDFMNWWNDKNTEHFQMALNVLFGSCLAFSLEISEYFAVYKTSSITLTVVGIIKEICTLILAVEWNGDKMTTTKLLGLAMCMVGVIGHVWKKYSNFKSTENPYGIIGSGGEVDNKHLTLPESDTDDDSDDSTEVLFDILNRRRS